MGGALSVTRPDGDLLDRPTPPPVSFAEMAHASGDVTLTLPRSAVGDFVSLSATLLDRMHELLERASDDQLSSVEREEVETLVQMAHFGQIVSMALQNRKQP
jgi:hypothetical protein